MPQETVPRVDPKPRSIDASQQCVIDNRRPDRHYVLANPNDDYCGLQAMLNMGLDFQIETLRKDGPRVRGGNTSREGDQIMWRGNVLISCPIENWKGQLEAGWKVADEYDKRSMAPGGIDGLRGTTGKPATHGEGAFIGSVRV